MPPNEPQAHVCIDDIAYGGDGVARLEDGVAVFVPYTAKGDAATVRITERHARYARAEIIELTAPGPDRIEPPCPYYGRCGGCCYQHLSPDAEQGAKLKQLRDLLRRVGGIAEPPAVASIVRSPQFYGYRNKITLQPLRLGAEHLHYGYARRESEEVVPIRACMLADERLNPLIAKGRRTQWGRRNQNAPHPTPMSLRVDAVGATTITFGRPPRRISWRREKLDGDRLFSVPVGGFSQVNPGVAVQLTAWVRDRIRAATPDILVDAYCGAGIFALTCAGDVRRVHGLEAHADSVAAAVYNAAQLELSNCFFTQGSVEAHLHQPLDAVTGDQTAAVILNPPRPGCDRKVLEQLLRFRPQTVVYVSCNPATLARDLKRLSAAYTLTELGYFDMFPRTAHFETGAVLRAKNA